LPRDQLGTVQAHRLEITQIAVVEVAINMVYQKLAVMLGSEPASVAGQFFLIAV